MHPSIKYSPILSIHLAGLGYMGIRFSIRLVEAFPISAPSAISGYLEEAIGDLLWAASRLLSEDCSCGCLAGISIRIPADFYHPLR